MLCNNYSKNTVQYFFGSTKGVCLTGATAKTKLTSAIFPLRVEEVAIDLFHSHLACGRQD